MYASSAVPCNAGKGDAGGWLQAAADRGCGAWKQHQLPDHSAPIRSPGPPVRSPSQTEVHRRYPAPVRARGTSLLSAARKGIAVKFCTRHSFQEYNGQGLVCTCQSIACCTHCKAPPAYCSWRPRGQLSAEQHKDLSLSTHIIPDGQPLASTNGSHAEACKA